jgi:hypothetical protein
MATLTDNQKKELSKLFKDNDLIKEDVYSSGQFTIITRSGIEKIQFKNKIKVRYEIVRCEEQFAVIKAIGTKGESEIETFGEYNITHVKFKRGTKDAIQNYPVATAEKRALSRVVLKLMNLYEHGFLGEDEEIPVDDSVKIPAAPKSPEEVNKLGDDKERQRKIDHINKSKTLEALARVKEHIKGDKELTSMYTKKLKELSK